MKRKLFYSSIEEEDARGRAGMDRPLLRRKKAQRQKIIQAFLSLYTWPGTIHYHRTTFKPLSRNGTMTIHIFMIENFQLLF